MNELTLYTTTWCPFCQRLTSDLDAAGVTYVNIDVDEDEAAGEWVKSVNDGNRIVALSCANLTSLQDKGVWG